MSRLLTIARNDFRHALSDRLVWGTVILLGIMWLPSVMSISPSVSPLREFVLSSVGDLMIFSLVVIAAVGYNSVTGERATGTVRLVLGLSGTREEFVLGKLLSRLVMVVLALGIALLVASGLAVRGYGISALIPFWVMAAWMLFYAVVWMGVAVGYSAAFSSQYRTLGALVGSFALFSPTVGIWRLFVHPLFALVFTGSFAIPQYETLAEAPQWIHIMYRSNPLRGFAEMATWSITVLTGGTPITGLGLNLVGLAFFGCCGALPLVFGMRRFERVDIAEGKSGPSWSDRLLPNPRTTAGRRDEDIVNRHPSLSTSDQSRVGTIVRGDLNRTLKNWVVQGAIALFVLLVAPRIWQDLRPTSFTTPSGEIFNLTYSITLPLLVLATAVGYQAVVGERESGTIRYVLGLPGTRRDFVVGKLIARLAIVVTAVVLTLLFAEVLVVIRFGRLHVTAFLAAGGWMLLLGMVWTTFAVGVSAAASSRYRAMAVILCSYVVFSVENGLWGTVVRPSIGLISIGRFETPQAVLVTNRLAPTVFRYLDSLSPLVALETIRSILATATDAQSFYTTPPVVLASIIVVLLFSTGTFYVGYRRFNRADL